MVKNFLYILLSISLQISSAEVPAEVKSALHSGSARLVSNVTERVIIQTIDAKTLNEESLNSLLENKDIEHVCYINRFFKNITKKNNCFIEDLQDNEFCNFLLKNPVIFQQLAKANRGNSGTLNVIREIWLRENKKLEGIDLVSALGCGLEAHPELKEGLEQSLERYEFYKKSRNNGDLFKQYDHLNAWEMAILYHHHHNVEDLEWGQRFSKTRNKFKSESAGSATQFIPYREKNKNGVSIHAGAPFYDYKPTTLAILNEYGGVCGAVSKGAAGFLASRGVPAYPIGQPGHCAFVYKNLSGEWVIGNNIYGWVWSGGHSGWKLPGSSNMSPWEGPPAIISSFVRFEQLNEARDSELCRAYSSLSKNNINKNILSRKAIEKAYGKNIAAWQDFISMQSRQISTEKKYQLAQKIVYSFRKDPIAAQYLLDQFIPLNLKKQDKYKIISQIIQKERVEDSAIQLYMQSFSKCLANDIPEIKGKVIYNVHKRRIFYSDWLLYYKTNKIKFSTKKKTLIILEQAIEGLLPNSSESIKHLKFYAECQKLWNDPRLIELGNIFLKRLLKEETDNITGIRNELIKVGIDIATLSKNKHDLEYYHSLQK